MRLEIIKQLQGRVIRVTAVMSRGGKVEVDPAGKRPDAIDAAVFSDKIEKRAVSGSVEPFRQQLQHLLLIGKHIGPAAAAGAGRAADSRSNFPTAEGMVNHPAAEPVRRPVEEGDLPPAVASGPLTPDDPSL